MSFIFPKNYNFKPKLLGFIDYSTAIIDTVIGIIIYFLVNTLFSSIDIKIYVFVSLFLPVLLISILGINKENPINVFKYMIKFIRNQNVYLYKKSYSFYK